MLPKLSYRRKSQRFMREIQHRLEQHEIVEMALLSKKWATIMDVLAGLIDRLSAVEVKSADQLYRLELYKQFLAESTDQYNRYATLSGEVIKAYQLEFGQAGRQSAQALLGLLDVKFNGLPIEAIINAVGKTSDGSPLVDVLIKRYQDSYPKVVNTLIESTALGRNPRVTARLIGADINDNLYNTLRIARTEQIDIFRETARDVYQANSDIVSGINLVTEPDACPVCLGVAAKNPYPLDYAFDELHPNCRCAFAPSI